MKTFSFIFIIILGIIFISGCVGGEKGDKLPSSAPTPSQNLQNSDFILKPDDLPSGFVLDSNSEKEIVPKNIICTLQNLNNCSINSTHNNTSNDWRYFGEHLIYKDSGNETKKMDIQIFVFDSNEGFYQFFENLDKSTKTDPSYEKSGQESIGDFSYWAEYRDNDTNLKNSGMVFLIKNSLIKIGVRDKKEKGHELALNISKILVNRLG